MSDEHPVHGGTGLFANPFPQVRLSPTSCTFLAGGSFFLAHGLFILAIVLEAKGRAEFGNIMSFVDWIPGILALDGYIVLGLINKNLFGRTGFLEAETRDTRNRKLAKFMACTGAALILAGVISSVIVLRVKYYGDMNRHYSTFYGWASFIQTDLLSLSAALLWIAQHGSHRSYYNLVV